MLGEHCPVRVVPPSPDSTDSVPPASRTRSRIPARPKPSVGVARQSPARRRRPRSRFARLARARRPARPLRARAWPRSSAPPARAGRPSSRARRRARLRRRGPASSSSASTSAGRLIAVAVEQRLERGRRPSSSSAAGRSSVMIARRFAISRSMCPIASSHRRPSPARVARCATRRGEQHAQPAERLERLVVELARPAPPLGLGRRERGAQTLALDALRGGDRRRGAGGEGPAASARRRR